MLTYSSTQDTPVRPTCIRFGLLSSEEVRRMAVVRVTETTLYYRGLPNSGGLLDPLMGSVDRRHLCASCLRNARSCQGHMGYIELAYPVYHIGYIDTVLKILRMTCFMCCRVCATEDDAASVKSLAGRARFTSLYSTIRYRKRCPHCSVAKPSFSRTSVGITLEWPGDMEWEGDEERKYCTAPFTAREALSILSALSDEDCTTLGLDASMSHPKNMILKTIVVPPPCTRPAIYASEGSRSRGQNDLTMKLQDILKRSLDLQAALGDVSWSDADMSSADMVERLARLQYEVFILVNNNVRGCKAQINRGSHAHKSIADRLKGKEGRVRGNLMGKRVDFSARCVITPDPYFACDRVGVPYHLAKTLTVPETVNAINARSLSKRVLRGSSAVHGAQTVIKKDGTVISLSHNDARESIVLQFGDIVERNLDDDDIVVFNRQPSLHKHGMQAHRVRLMPGHTFRLSLVVASPYNADFDGDEMNLHVPQSEMARAECATLLSVQQNVIGPQSNKPTLGIVQDSLLGLHILTLPGCVLDHASVCRILGSTVHLAKSLPRPALVINVNAAPLRLWTGKQLFSKLLPSQLYVEPPSVTMAEVLENDAAVVVRGGALMTGTLRKSHVGTSAGGIVDVLCREHGGHACCRFFDDAQRMTHAFLLVKGFGVGIRDVVLSAEGHTRVAERLTKATQLCEDIQREVSANDVPSDVAIIAEQNILRLLSKTLMQCGSIVNEHMDRGNAIRRMVEAGSKGTFINLSQICAALGQQSLEGSRIFAHKGGRTLPYFEINDPTLASRGLVSNSYALGLSPTDLFFHAIGGREGLVDTAVKTSQTGYLQRRMNKSFEDHTVHANRAICNAMGEVISFTWGSDGFHPALLERVPMQVLVESDASLRRRMTPPQADLLKTLRASVLKSKTHVLCSELDKRVLLPFHPLRLKRWIRRLASESEGEEDPVHAAAAEQKVIALATRPGMPCTVGMAVLDVCCDAHVRALSAQALERVLGYMRDKIDGAVCPCGESVGSLSAQSTGEPCTQMTLNTFHFAGVSSKNVTLGIPKLKELIDASHNPKTPLTVIRFKKPYSTSERFATYFANTTPLTRLADIVLKCEVLHDPDVDHSLISEDRWFVELDRDVQPNIGIRSYARHIIRMELHKELMHTRMLTPPMIRTLLKDKLGNRGHVISSETNAVDWIVRIRFGHVADMLEMGSFAQDQESILIHRASNMLLDTVHVCGHPEVTNATVSPGTVLVMPHGANGEEEAVVAQDEYTVNAYGPFLVDCAASDAVDWERCTCNDIWETYSFLGIEACAHVLFDQLKAVISFDGQYVDDRHLALIVDSMCRSGTIVPLNRHGINKADTSPLMRASFEETVDVLCDAALYAKTENAKGVTTSIMTGQLAEIGSGAVDVLFHDSCLSKRHATLVSSKPRKRVLRSRCRSFVESDVATQVMEYSLSDTTGRIADSSNPTFRVRSHVRFRSISPPCEPSAGPGNATL